VTDVQPRARVRPTTAIVSPPPRTRAPVASLPPAQQPRARVRTVIPNALPLKILQQSHNGWDIQKLGGEPDPRFAPLIIVMNPLWRKELPGYVKARLEEALSWTATSKFPEMHWTTPAYFTEWAIRHYLHKALMANDVFEALEAYIVANYDDTNVPTHAMSKVVDGVLVVDMTKGSGPFYLDTVAAIDIHYSSKLRNIRP
jgi:hypothetical protein